MANASLGAGIVVEIAPVPTGSTAVPTDKTFTLDGAVSAAATSLTITETLTVETGASPTVPAYITFTDSTGDETLVALTSDIVGTTVGCVALVDDIADAATAPLFSELGLRESADFALNQSSEDLTTLDNDGYTITIPTTKNASYSLPGAYAATDAGFQNCFAASVKAARSNDVYLRVTEPAPSAKYSTGTIYEGACKVTIDGITGPAGGIRKSNLTLSFQRQPTVTDPA